MTDRRRFYECGICDHIHPWACNGDCREDANRLTLDDLKPEDELLTMEDRINADIALADHARGVRLRPTSDCKNTRSK